MFVNERMTGIANIEKARCILLLWAWVFGWAGCTTGPEPAQLIHRQAALVWEVSDTAVLPSWWCWPTDTSWLALWRPYLSASTASPWLGAAHWDGEGRAELLFAGKAVKAVDPDSVVRGLGSGYRLVRGSFRKQVVWSVWRGSREWCAWSVVEGRLVVAAHAWMVEDAIDSWRRGDRIDPFPEGRSAAVWRIEAVRAQWQPWWRKGVGTWWRGLLAPFGKCVLLHEGEVRAFVELKPGWLGEAAPDSSRWMELLQLIPAHSTLVLAGPARWLQPVAAMSLPAEAQAVAFWSDLPADAWGWGMALAAPPAWDAEAEWWPEAAGRWHMFPLYRIELDTSSAFMAEVGRLYVLASSAVLLQRMLEAMVGGAHLAHDSDWLEKVGPQLEGAVAWGRVQFRDWPLLRQRLGNRTQPPFRVFEGAWTFVAHPAGQRQLEVSFPEQARAEKGEVLATLTWRHYLPEKVEAGPWVAADRIFVQLADHRLAAFSLAGRFEWALPLDGPLMGAVQATWIDRLQSEVLVMNTRRHVILLTPAGQHVPPSPFRLDLPATAPLRPVDFLDDGKPWFFLPVGKQVRVFDEFLRTQDSWRAVRFPHPVEEAVCFLQDATKDYLAFLSADGTLAVYDRLGGLRFRHRCRAVPAGAPDGQVHRLSKRFVLPLQHGKIEVVTLDGRSFALRLPLQQPGDFRFAFADVVADGRKDYIGLSGRQLVVWGYEGQRFRSFGTHTFADRPDWLGVWSLPQGPYKGLIACGLPDGRIVLLRGDGRPLLSQMLAGERAALYVGQGGRGYVAVCDGKELLWYRLPANEASR